MTAPVFQREMSKDILTGITITSLIFLAAVFLPVVGFFFSVFIPLPVLFYRAKLGRATGLIVPVAAIIIMAVVLGGASIDILFFTALLMLGFVLSELFEKNLSVEKTIGYACGIVMAAGGLFFILYSTASNISIYKLASDYVANNLKLSLALYKGMGIPKETIDILYGSIDKIQYVLIRILPSLITASTIFVAWTNVLAARRMFEKKGIGYPDFGELTQWRAPEQMIWGLIGSGIAILIPETRIKLIGINGLLIMLTIYFFQGISIVAFYFDKKKFPKPVRIILYGLIGIQQLALVAVIVLGMFDMWINFRKSGIDKNKQDQP